ncbi:3-deoxy-manno-octulosonate cytidylyltransferase [Candidatus Erwinia haradaeae]|uniref:3-deoxy-manno-octulosonate cytidylyltransferase n=1 Tax=Candidatus Erwinia haradaeae TaxID=1922217 RepID=A0A451DAN4_9GAMM|nr:3-deoxy-manno-octulosonate cytidylyltransferase [Candidatus Erwinia haradaeae]VFP83314.1 3-deoxy-manno-octulosonate cytidylyltransferase [Candidatus Erwinia haradaeae]
MQFIVIIPARFSSQRMPGKPLSYLHGKPMILHVAEKAFKSGAQKVIVATDHADIAHVMNAYNIEVCMTRQDHQSGTERLAEVIDIYQYADDTIIVNVQGDEPMVPPVIIRQAAENLSIYNVNVATLATPIISAQALQNHNIVKVIRNIQGYAIYFSRAMIPWIYDKNPINMSGEDNPSLRHIGIYSYYAGFIRRYAKWKTSCLEQYERLEQLRILWYGEKIHVDIAKVCPEVSVDTIEDLTYLNKQCKK